MTDPIADLLTRIRNAYKAHNSEVRVPFSNQKLTIAKVLAAAGYVGEVSVEETQPKSIVVKLKYTGRNAAITTIDRISTPGRRVYSGVNDIKPVLAGNGIRIISTSQGIMIDTEAKAKHLGGEVICKVW